MPDTAPAAPIEDAAAGDAKPRADRLGAMEAEIRQLRVDVNALQEQFAQFRKQFE